MNEDMKDKLIAAVSIFILIGVYAFGHYQGHVSSTYDAGYSAGYSWCREDGKELCPVHDGYADAFLKGMKNVSMGNSIYTDVGTFRRIG